MDIATRLAELMDEMGVTSAKKLATLSGVSQTMISRVLRGDASPTTATLELLCGALGVTMQEFYAPDAQPADDDLWELREQLRRTPGARTLFSMTKNATSDDIEKAVRILAALRGEDEENGRRDPY